MAKSDYVLKVNSRTETGSSASRRLRRANQIPCVAYGGDGNPMLLVGNDRDIEAVSNYSGVVTIEVTDSNVSRSVMVKEIQRDHLGMHILHVDFIEVRMDQAITTEIPVELTGTAAGLSQGGELQQMLFAIEVECLPSDIPELIEVDITDLEIDQSLTLGQVSLPAKVALSDNLDPESPLVQIVQPRVAEEDDAEGGAEGGEQAEPEVIAKGTEEEGE